MTLPVSLGQARDQDASQRRLVSKDVPPSSAEPLSLASLLAPQRHNPPPALSTHRVDERGGPEETSSPRPGALRSAPKSDR
jgi:hypothetical protein